MGRARIIGITPLQLEQLQNWKALSHAERSRLAYDIRKIIEKELDDLQLLISKAPMDFKKGEGLEIYPVERILPRDIRRIHLTIQYLEEWISTLNLIKEAVLAWGVDYTRRY